MRCNNNNNKQQTTNNKQQTTTNNKQQANNNNNNHNIKQQATNNKQQTTNNKQQTTRRRTRRTRRTRTRADLGSLRSAKLHKSWILDSGTLSRTCVVCHAGEAPLATPNLSTHCHVFYSFLCMWLYPWTSFLKTGMAHTHVCYLPSSFALPALFGGLDHAFGLSLLLWALPTVPTLFSPVLPTQTPQLDSHERPQPEGHRQCAMLYNTVVGVFAISATHLHI